MKGVSEHRESTLCLIMFVYATCFTQCASRYCIAIYCVRIIVIFNIALYVALQNRLMSFRGEGNHYMGPDLVTEKQNLYGR